MKTSLQKTLTLSAKAALFVLVREIAKFGSLNFIIGSHCAFFSLSHCVAPLIGSSTGVIGALLALSMSTLYKTLTPHAAFMILAYHIPSFFGALSFSCVNNSSTTATFVKKIVLSSVTLSCIVLFMVHPVGIQAAPYALLWLIPLTLLALNTKNIFLHALRSTFITHAVGSVLWLYTLNNLTAPEWLAIMPIALVERFLFALGTTICYYSMQAVYQKLTQRTVQPVYNQ